MRCTRDRALLACSVCSGARASELLGLRMENIDWCGMRMWVLRKGSAALTAVQLSPEAALLLAAYLGERGWLGEVAAIETTMAAASQKLEAMRKAAARKTTVNLGMPNPRLNAGRISTNG